MRRRLDRPRAALVAFVALVAVTATLAAAFGPAASARAPRPPRAVAPIPTAVQSDNSLALALLHRLSPGGNVVFSPYSIDVALAMARAGARGETAAQIDRVLGVARRAPLVQGLASISARLTAPPASPSAPQLSVANSTWVQSGLPLRGPFAQLLATDFGAPAQVADFASAPETARAAINAWVAAHTANEIPNLFPDGTITKQTALVLADAVYLAAHWSYPFDQASTSPGPFYPPSGPAVQVPFMNRGIPARLAYARGPGYRAVELPYRDSKLSMLFVMPAPRTLRAFGRSLTPASLARLTTGLKPRRLALSVPRFELRFDTDLSGALTRLGMPVAFTDAADFSGITAAVRLKIAAVEHAADLRVDEAGTVAVAATGITLVPTAIELPRGTRLTLNHPFLAFLRDDATGAILFMARVTNPA